MQTVRLTRYVVAFVFMTSPSAIATLQIQGSSDRPVTPVDSFPSWEVLFRQRCTIGDELFGVGRWNAAEENLKAALKIADEHLDGQPIYKAECLCRLAGVERQRGNYRMAWDLADRSLGLIDNLTQRRDVSVAGLLAELGYIFEDTDRLADAEKVLVQSLAIFNEKLAKSDYWALDRPLRTLGMTYIQQGKYSAAEPILRRSLSVSDTYPGTKSTMPRAMTLCALGTCLSRQGKYVEAAPLLAQAVEMGEENGRFKPHMVRLLCARANLERDTGQFAEAEADYRNSELIARTPQCNPQALYRTMEEHAAALHKAGRSEEAKTMESKAATIKAKCIH